MKISNKIPKGAAIIAAILSLLFFVLGIVINMRSWIVNFRVGNPQIIMNILRPQIFNLIMVVLAVIVLLRGKKDVFAGILFLVNALIEAGRSIRALISLFGYLRALSNMDPTLYRVMGNVAVNLIVALLAVVFYLLIALECFKPGKISGSGGKVMLFILPIVSSVISMIGSVILQSELLRYGGRALTLTLITMLLTMIIKLVPQLLTGIAFAIPAYEQPQVEQVDYTQPYTNV